MCDMSSLICNIVFFVVCFLVSLSSRYGTPPTFYDRPDDKTGNFSLLKKWYKIVSTSLDRNGVEYISTIEGVKYPFTGEFSRGVLRWRVHRLAIVCTLGISSPHMLGLGK